MLIWSAACSTGGIQSAPEAPPAPVEEAAPPPEQAPAPAPAEAAPAAGGLYSSDQATRGGEVFEQVCAECHTTSEFRGRSFQADWGRRSVYSFYRTLRSTMPDDNPGGLADQIYLDVTAYILDMNGHTAGDGELSADSPMREFRIDPEAGSER